MNVNFSPQYMKDKVSSREPPCNFHQNSRIKKNGGPSESNANHFNYSKKLSSNINMSPVHQSQRTAQSNRKKTSLIEQENSFYSEFLQKLKKEEELQGNNIIEENSKITNQRKQIFHLKNKNSLNMTIVPNNNSNVRIICENQQIKSNHKYKNPSASPVQHHREKPEFTDRNIYHENNKISICEKNNMIQTNNSSSKYRASVSYFVSNNNNNTKNMLLNNNNHVQPNILTVCNHGNKEQKKLRKQRTIVQDKGYEIESNLNVVQFLRPDIIIRKFVSKWEPIDKFGIFNVETFSNYGACKVLPQTKDSNTKSIINNIIITSGVNNANTNENNMNNNNETARNKQQISENKQNSNNQEDKPHNVNNIKKYTSMDLENHSQKNTKSPGKKKKKFLCCL